MLLNVRELAAKKQRIDLRAELPIDGVFEGRRDAASCGPVEAFLTAEAVSGVVEVRGTLVAGVEYVCARCLCSYCRRMIVPFAESFALESDWSEDDETLRPVDDDRIDLRPYIEEALQLALPFVPLCCEDCRGLTPDGVNRNVYPDADDGLRIDPRWEALKSWRWETGGPDG